MNISNSIHFSKMSGAGNDFIIIDHRQPFLTDETAPDFARLVCRRKFSAGADGLILIESSATEDFKWQFYNADGSVAEMCGNGARCAARFAYDKKIASSHMRFGTIAGVIAAEMVGDAVKIKLTPPVDLRLNLSIILEREMEVHSLNTGVPHVVCFVDDIDGTPVTEWGRKIRNHELFQPAGSNVNFVQVTAADQLTVRTYERGVEDETMACGTGAVAAAVVAALSGKATGPLKVTTSGGEQLTIHLGLDAAGVVSEVFLEGAASFVYEGEFHKDALCV